MLKHFAVMSKEKQSYEEMSTLLKQSDPECQIRRVHDAAEAYQYAKRLDSSVCFIDIEHLSVASDFFESDPDRMPDPTEAMEKRLYELKQYILRHLDDPLKLSELARRMYITPNYLASIFKRREGESVFAFIERERMMEAKKLLENGHYRISQIAVRTGYENESYFCRVFRKHFQMTPSEFRRRLREQRQTGANPL